MVCQFFNSSLSFKEVVLFRNGYKTAPKNLDIEAHMWLTLGKIQKLDHIKVFITEVMDENNLEYMIVNGGGKEEAELDL